MKLSCFKVILKQKCVVLKYETLNLSGLEGWP